MGGGLAQLVLRGQMDGHITANPNINYFKHVYNRHVNFSMHNVKTEAYHHGVIKLNNPDQNISVNFKIGRSGDLVNNMFLSLNLPDIYSTEVHRFRWIKNIGHMFIIEAIIKTDGNVVIDRLYGEWMNIWNELTSKEGDDYNKLIGNIPEYIAPNNNSTKYVIRNNKLYNDLYPSADKIRDKENPSIKGRELQIPLNFWFTRNPSLALPIYKMHGREILVDITTRSIEKLYQVWCNKLRLYVSPAFYNKIYHSGEQGIDIKTFIDSQEPVSINYILYVNYVLLDSKYREVALSGINEYIVDYVTVTNNEFINISDSSKTVTLTNLSNQLHVKELIWVLRRTDIVDKFNIYDNYTASHLYNENMGILKTAKISWARTIVREEENAYFFNNIQPYQYHTNVPRTGLYCYSFSLFPEKIITAGSYNSQRVSTSLTITINNNNDSGTQKNIVNRNEYKYLFKLLKLTSLDEKYGYNENNINFEILIFSKVINVFMINGGITNFKYNT
jgi:hypothetical protein